MGFKKITVKRSAPCENECPPLVESVSQLEIKDISQDPPLSRKKAFPISGGAVFICLCCAVGLLFYFIPVPEGFTSSVMAFASFFSERSAESDIFIPQGSENMKTASLAPFNIPAGEKDGTGNELPLSLSLSPSASQSPVFGAKTTFTISNETNYNINFDSLMNEALPVASLCLSESENGASVPVFAQTLPEVLIIHTHGTEGYSDSAKSNYRTTDTGRNVVAAGRVLAEQLEKNGVSVIHCEEMFDENSYIRAYSLSYSAVSEYLKKYPSIKYVIDLHRDAVSGTDGGYARLIHEKDGVSYAQLMLVVGTDEAGARHPEWIKNLRVAAEIQNGMNFYHEGIMRPINLRRASFNQQLCRGYFILEAGNCGNTLGEATDALCVFAQSFAKTMGAEKQKES